MSSSNKTIAEQWREELKNEGYEHHIRSEYDLKRLKSFSRTWRRIFSYIQMDYKCGKHKSIFEFGCGGGNQLAPFFVHGWKCVGIDCSADVLSRAENYFKEIKKNINSPGDISFICDDFLLYKSIGQYDIVFHFGAVEHFLNDEERESVIKKMFALTKKGGYVVSVVPSGVQPLRQKFKSGGLAGYHIPEIDYSPRSMKGELEKCGGKNVVTCGHNIMGYLLSDNKNRIYTILYKLIYLFFQLIPTDLLPKYFSDKHGMSIIGIAQK